MKKMQAPNTARPLSHISFLSFRWTSPMCAELILAVLTVWQTYV